MEDYKRSSHTNYLKHLDFGNTYKQNNHEIRVEKPQLINRCLNMNRINDINNNVRTFKNENYDTGAINIYEKDIEKNALFKPGTTLIVGDSMIYGIDEKRLKNCKVRVYPGASIEDMHFNLIPLLRKRPSVIILHVGCNNCVNENSAQVMKKLILLKDFILSNIDCKLFFSSIIDRCDDAKARLTGFHTNRYIHNLGIEIIDNSNISRKHMGRKGLHLTPFGTAQLVINFLRVLKSL